MFTPLPPQLNTWNTVTCNRDRFYGTYQTADSVCLVEEYLHCSDVTTLIMHRGRIEPPTARFYAAEVALALRCIHSLGFAYRDVKSGASSMG